MIQVLTRPVERDLDDIAGYLAEMADPAVARGVLKDIRDGWPFWGLNRAWANCATTFPTGL